MKFKLMVVSLSPLALLTIIRNFSFELPDEAQQHSCLSNGGLTMPTVTGDENLSGNENPFGIKLGQTMKKPTFNR